MNKPDVAKLLTAIYAYERRLDTVGVSEVEAWFPLLEDLDYDYARRAVTKHFLTSDRYLTVSRLRVLTGEVAAAMHVPAEPVDSVDAQLRVPDADPDDPSAYAQALRQGSFQPRRRPEDYPPRELKTSGVGRTVPRVSAEEVADDEPRPRRWWMKWATKPPTGEDS